MISSQTKPWMAILVLAFVSSGAWTAEPNEAPVPLVFEIGPVTPGPLRGPTRGPSFGSWWQPFISHKAVYAAAVRVVGPTEFLPLPKTGWARDFLSFAQQHAGLSPRQKAFLDAARGVYENAGTTASTGLGGRVIILNPLIERSDPNGPERVLLYAVTQEDAQKMAQAYFQFARQAFRTRVGGFEQDIRRYREEIESTKKKIAETQERLETAQNAFLDFQRTVPYREDDEARQAIGELDRMLNAAQVEIAGITAKIKAIQAYRREQALRSAQIPQEGGARLDTMFVEESIALRGAEARKEMATKLREQANRFIDLKATLTNAPGEKKRLAETLDGAQRNLATYEGNLATTRLKEPKIPDKIVIYPIQWAGEAAPN